MPISKPYHRNYRGFVSRPDAGYSSWAYIVDKEYAQSPEHYIRAFLIIQNDLIKLFEYIEPSPESLETYSYRIHELFMRTCIEIEANFKAILKENTFSPRQDGYGNDIYNMSVYRKVNKTHRLSSYKAILPIWNGPKRVFEPFKSWGSGGGSLDWYQSYNASKHDRQDKFKKANLENLLDSITALLILLSSQFRKEEFSPSTTGLAISSGNEYYDMSPALGGYFRIKFPDDWPENEKYDFNWKSLENLTDRFEKIDYNSIE